MQAFPPVFDQLLSWESRGFRSTPTTAGGHAGGRKSEGSPFDIVLGSSLIRLDLDSPRHVIVWQALALVYCFTTRGSPGGDAIV